MKSFKVLNLPLALVVSCFLLSMNHVSSKECTDLGLELNSHSFRYELLSSKNDTRINEVYSQHNHRTLMDKTALRSRKMLRKEDKHRWLMIYEKMNTTHNAVTGLLKEVSLHDVRLDPKSKHGEAQNTNLEYLLMLNVDSLVWSFRKTAGLETPGKAYGGWEEPEGQLRGHFVGHYMSASAHMWASTHSETLKEKMFGVVYALSACQRKIGSGYLSAFPSEYFDRVETFQNTWAPYYTIHKIMAGLLDQHLLASNPQSLKMLLWMVDYFYNRVQNVIVHYSIERHWQILNEETGGINDILYKLYTLMGDSKHLVLAHLFDKPCFLGLLAVKADNIAGFHANAHIPIVVGAQMCYEITGNPLYKEIGTFFMDIVNSSHTYVTGGTSIKEHWSDPNRLADSLGTDNEETCTTYNMLKVSRHLFRWTKEMAYADYYEKSLTNGLLSIQRGTDPGVMIYFLPLARGSSKAISSKNWGTKFDSFWCCYGTGIESLSKLGDSIYFEEEGQTPGLYIIQYISSSLNWRSGKILLNQKVEPAVSWDPRLLATFTISSSEGGTNLTSTLHFRIPSWTYSNGAKVSLNGQDYGAPSPGNFLSITRKWIPGDKIFFDLPFGLQTEPIKDDRPEYASLQAFLFGPYVLAGLSNDDWDIKTESPSSILDSITSIPSSYNSHLISLYQYSGNSTFTLTNLNNTITIDNAPQPGTSTSVHATFRIIIRDSTLSNFTKPEDAIGKRVTLEPFDRPGMVLFYLKDDGSISIKKSTDVGDSIFLLVPGLDEKTGSVSLMVTNKEEACYVYSGANYESDFTIKISCKSETTDADFDKRASFVMKSGISSYHLMSFVLKGKNRNFLLMPLFSLSDEYYTVYFNIQS